MLDLKKVLFILLCLDHLRFLLVQLLKQQVVRFVHELFYKSDVAGVFVAMQDKPVTIVKLSVAQLTYDKVIIWLTILSPVVSVPRLLSPLQVQLCLKLKRLQVAFLPVLARPVFVVSLREHHLQRRDVSEVVQLFDNDANQMVVATLAKGVLWQALVVGSQLVFACGVSLNCILSALLFEDFSVHFDKVLVILVLVMAVDVLDSLILFNSSKVTKYALGLVVVVRHEVDGF